MAIDFRVARRRAEEAMLSRARRIPEYLVLDPTAPGMPHACLRNAPSGRLRASMAIDSELRAVAQKRPAQQPHCKNVNHGSGGWAAAEPR